MARLNFQQALLQCHLKIYSDMQICSRLLSMLSYCYKLLNTNFLFIKRLYKSNITHDCAVGWNIRLWLRYYSEYQDIKRIVHPRINILSSFTHPQVVPNLCECLCSTEHKGRCSEECVKQSSSGAPLTSRVFFFPTMEVNGAPKQLVYTLSSKYLPLCSTEQRNSHRFGTSWGWVNDDRMFIFGWTIPLRPAQLNVW